MKLGVSMWSYFHAWKAGKIAGVGDFIREAKRAGADGVELLDVFYRDRDIDLERNDALLALKETGLPVGVFSVAQNFAKPTMEERMEELAKIKFGIEEAEFYGAQTVRVFAGDVRDGLAFDDARAWIIEGLAHASVYAEQIGVRLALENHGKLAGRADQVRAIIDDVREMAQNEVLGANPDTGNFLLVDEDPGASLEAVAPFARMVHLKDFQLAPPEHEGFAYEALSGKKYVGTAVGEGDVPLAQCLRALQKSAFDGWVNVEYEGEEDAFTAVPRSIAAARRLLGA